MASWITTHYAHRTPDKHPWHIYLRREHEDVGREIRVGDKVVFYELAGNRPLRNDPPMPRGRQGIVVTATVTGFLSERPPSKAIAEYADGTRANWKWELRTTDQDRNGFVSRSDVLEILEFDKGYTMRGFGKRNSVVKELSDSQYGQLIELFRSGTPQ